MSETKMTDKELAKLFLLRSDMKASLEEVDEKIRAAVLARGESFVVADTKATYYQASRKYDYALAAASHPNVDRELIEAHTTVKESTAWKAVCEAAGIPADDIPSEEVPARVVVK